MDYLNLIHDLIVDTAGNRDALDKAKARKAELEAEKEYVELVEKINNINARLARTRNLITQAAIKAYDGNTKKITSDVTIREKELHAYDDKSVVMWLIIHDHLDFLVPTKDVKDLLVAAKAFDVINVYKDLDITLSTKLEKYLDEYNQLEMEI